MICMCACLSLHAQKKVETVDFKTGVAQIMEDIPNNYEKIKAEKKCENYCHMKFMIAGSDNKSCEVSESFANDRYNICNLSYTYVDYSPADSAKYAGFGYADTDSSAVMKSISEMKTALYDVAIKIYPTIQVYVDDCELNEGDKECQTYRLRTDTWEVHFEDYHILEYYEIEMKWKHLIFEDGVDSWLVFISFEQQQL